MNNILIDRLNECNITKTDILSNIKKTKHKQSIFVYTSHLEGLGTKDSDFDIYVLSESMPDIKFSRDYDHYKVHITTVKDMLLDVEYWNISDVYNLIDDINNLNYTKLDMEELKLIHRLRVGEIISELEIGMQIKTLIENSKLREHVLKLYVLYANSELEDAINMYNSREYICALKCARNSLENAIGALNAKNGISNLKPKWIPKIFLNNNGYNEEILNKYLKYQIYSNVDKGSIDSFVEEIIEFIQNILSKVAI